MDIFYIKTSKNDYKSQHNSGLYIVEYVAVNFYKLRNSEIRIINKKPEFKYQNDIHFSISHSDNIAAVCFDNRETGFDIEMIKDRNFMPIADKMKFNLKENTLECFYQNWTAYEAEYKLQKAPKCIYTSKLNDEYIFSIASAENTDIQSELKIFSLQA